MKKINYSQVTAWLLVTTLACSVLLVLPFTNNFFSHSEIFSLFIFTLLLGVVYAIHALTKKAVAFVISPFLFPVLLFGVTVIASTFFTQAYPYENLLGLGGAFIALTLLIIFGAPMLNKKTSEFVLFGFGTVAAILAITTLLQLTPAGISTMINSLFGLQLPDNLAFNLTGSAYIGTQVLIISLIGLIAHVIHKKHIGTIHSVLIPIILIGLVVHVWSILPGKPASLPFPSWVASWSVALDAIRVPRTALIGTGPATYATVYTQFKPTWVNGTDIWNIRFFQPSNVPLSLLTTLGFMGLISWVILALQVFKYIPKAISDNRPVIFMLLSTFLLQLLFPANVVVYIIQAVLLTVLIGAEKENFSILKFQALKVSVVKELSTNRKQIGNVSAPLYIFVVALVFAVGLGFYFVGQSYAAHIIEARALNPNTNLVQRYELQQVMLQRNPYLASFRRQFALTNLEIAAALSEKADLTEQESTQIGQLLEQAIREARSATLLDPSDSQNWLVLAEIYRNMIPITEEAQQWAIQSYVSAIQTDPTNPNLRVELGNVFLNAQDYQQAANFYQQATNLKPDLANAHYSLAVAAQELGQLALAEQEYQIVLQLIDPSSEDYTIVTQQLEELQKAIAEQAPAEGEEAAQTPAQNQTAPSIVNENLTNQVETNTQNTTPLNELSTPTDDNATDEENGNASTEETQTDNEAESN